MTDDITWAIAYLEDDAEACSAVNGERDAATKDARRLETTFKRLVRERDESSEDAVKLAGDLLAAYRERDTSKAEVEALREGLLIRFRPEH